MKEKKNKKKRQLLPMEYSAAWPHWLLELCSLMKTQIPPHTHINTNTHRVFVGFSRAAII